MRVKNWFPSLFSITSLDYRQFRTHYKSILSSVPGNILLFAWKVMMPTCITIGVCPARFKPSGSVVAPYALLGNPATNRHGLSSLCGLPQPGRVFLPKGSILSRTSAPLKPKTGSVAVRADGNEGPSTSTSTTTSVVDRSQADALVDGMTFGELCNDFECISSPAVEATARQLAKDILEMREEKRALGIFAIFVKYKDPLRSFKGREKYHRLSWLNASLEKPSVAVREMRMLSTSVLNIKWTVRGKPKLPPASVIGGSLVWNISSFFTLNQISGQVVEQVDEWDLTGSSPLAQAYFWASRLAYSTIEAGRDAGGAVIGVTKLLDKKEDDRPTYFQDPSGDPRKFFQVEENPQRDIYQLGLIIALLYLLVQFLKLTL